MLCSKLSQSSMGPDIKGKNICGKFPIPSHKLASLRSASKNEKSNHIPFAAILFIFETVCGRLSRKHGMWNTLE